MVKIVFSSNNSLELSQHDLEYYNYLRERAGLKSIYNNIPRHDPYLVETVELLNTASVIDINCNEYSIILDDIGERVIPNPELLLYNLFLDLKKSYYNNEDCTEKLIYIFNLSNNVNKIDI